jgi:hypothetical protein
LYLYLIIFKVFIFIFFIFSKVNPKVEKIKQSFFQKFPRKKNEFFLFQNKKHEISLKISPPAEKEQKREKKERLICFVFYVFFEKR